MSHASFQRVPTSTEALDKLWENGALAPEVWRTWCISKTPAHDACTEAIAASISALGLDVIAIESVSRRHVRSAPEYVFVPLSALVEFEVTDLEPTERELRFTYWIIQRLKEIRRRLGKGRDDLSVSDDEMARAMGEQGADPESPEPTADKIYPDHLDLPSKDEAENLLFLEYVKRHRPEKSWKEIGEMLGRAHSYCYRKIDELGLEDV